MGILAHAGSIYNHPYISCPLITFWSNDASTKAMTRLLEIGLQTIHLQTLQVYLAGG